MHTVVLKELGVDIKVPESLYDLTYTASTTQAVGTVLRLSTKSLEQATSNFCNIGFVYDIQKASLTSTSTGTRWTEATLKAATQSQEGIPPQAKEFPTFYFVFEPTQATCALGDKNLALEAEQRESIWRAIETATAR
jgi:hypothetical protein